MHQNNFLGIVLSKVLFCYSLRSENCISPCKVNYIQWFSLSSNQRLISDGFLSLALQLMVITSNVAIVKSQGNWYCSPLANKTCANASSYVDCLGQNDSCKAYSCIPQSEGCSCMVGSYNCTSECYYEVRVPDICKYKADSHSCLRGVSSTVLRVYSFFVCPMYFFFFQFHPFFFFPSRFEESRQHSRGMWERVSKKWSINYI